MTDNDELMRQRGIYATLGGERRALVKEVTKIAAAMMSAVSSVQTLAQHDDPDWDQVYKMIGGITTNNERLSAELGGLRAVLDARQKTKPLAWPEGE